MYSKNKNSAPQCIRLKMFLKILKRRRKRVLSLLTQSSHHHCPHLSISPHLGLPLNTLLNFISLGNSLPMPSPDLSRSFSVFPVLAEQFSLPFIPSRSYSHTYPLIRWEKDLLVPGLDHLRK